MTPLAHAVFAVAAASTAVAAVRIARAMTVGRSLVGSVAVLTLFVSWALCVWLTPVGPYVWRASALGFLVAGSFLAVSLAAARGVVLPTGEPQAPLPEPVRVRTLHRALWLLLLLFALPVVAHFAAS